MGREVRMVPPDWKHPTDAGGHYIPLFDGKDYARILTDWIEGNEKWEEGLRSDFNGGWVQRDDDEKKMSYSDWDGDCPQEKDYMPSWPAEVATHFMMYEDTSEGTPISPAFATPEELARWLVDNGANAFAGMTATYEQWLATIHAGSSPAMVIDNGRIKSGVEYVAERGK